MHPAQVSAQDIENARIILIVIVAGAVLFRRFVLQVALAILVVAVVVGVITLLQGVHL